MSLTIEINTLLFNMLFYENNSLYLNGFQKIHSPHELFGLEFSIRSIVDSNP